MTRKIEDYVLKVTAGTSRDKSTHKPVPVNTETPLHLETDLISADLFVRVEDLRSNTSLPSTSPYFSTPPHLTNKDKYSISFSPITFKQPVNGDDLTLGNDFDEPISKNLPPGFSIAWRVARWVVDPGLEGDPWADKPWLEGRCLGSVNVLDVGERKKADGKVDLLEEGVGKKVKLKAASKADGGDDGGEEEGEGEAIPADSAGRMKFFMNEEKRKRFTFEKGEKYWVDFFNPYLDFSQFALHLPGISIHILQYWDGQPLRYVLRNRVDGTVYLVVQFMLELKEGVEEEDGDEEGSGSDDDDDDDFESVDEEKAEEAIAKAKKDGAAPGNSAQQGVGGGDDDVD